MDLKICFIKQGQQALELTRKPADLVVAVVPAAGLGLAVAVEEGPVGGPPVLLPEAVFFQHGLSQVFSRLRLKPPIGPQLCGQGSSGRVSAQGPDHLLCGEEVPPAAQQEAIPGDLLTLQAAEEVD